jgi:hypothetical protein
MEDSNHLEEHHRFANQLLASGVEMDKIKEQLVQKGISDHELHLVLMHLKNLQHVKKRERGLWLIIIGSFMLAVAGVSAVFMFGDDNFRIALYGLTSFGLLVLMLGMYNIFND